MRRATLVLLSLMFAAAAASQVPPQIVSFTATPVRIRAGQSATLAFVTRGATSVEINGVVSPRASGIFTVSPTQTTTYVLTASAGNQIVRSIVTVVVNTAPSVSISSFPAALIQARGRGGATSSYAVTNNGGSPTTVTVSQTADFFTQSPATFDLAPGATQVVTLTAVAQPTADAFLGFATLSGNGASGLRVPVRLLSAEPPSLPLTARAIDNRVDVSAAAGSSPSGSARFRNNGPGLLTGTVVSSVPWIIPQVAVVTIQPGTTQAVPFLIDRSQRPDSDLLLGSASGNLSLYYISSTAAGKGAFDHGGSTVTISKVNVVDTVGPATTAGAPPPIAAGEVALFVAGLGHVTGTVGQFISDFSIFNPLSNRSIDDVRLYYTPAGATLSSDSTNASIQLASARAVTVGDAVKTVFGQETLGTLQIRSQDAGKLSVNASVFVSSNPAGTFGTTIPILRSDRGVAVGGNAVIPGLRRDASSHTNLYIQEVQGASITVQTEFIAADGSTVSTRSDDLGPFGLKTLGSIVPEGAVSAVLSATSGGGRFHAFATPVDDASNDTWAVADWSAIYGYPADASTVIPVAGVLQGAGNTFFRTDAAIMNRGSGTATGTISYLGRAGELVSKSVSLGSRQSMIISDIVGTLFGAADGSVGYITFTPLTGSFAVTSRTYTTVAGAPATFGTGVPALSSASALRRGEVRAIASLEDAALATVVAQRPATFRTNFGLLETAGSSVKVRVTVKFTFPAGPKTTASGSGFKDYDLAPNQFLLVNGLTADVLGPARATLGELRHVDADFQVIDGEGALMVFTSSVDNGTGDSVLRID